MDDRLRQNLETCETDIAGVMDRFSGNETLYLALLSAFLEDSTVELLNAAIETRAWDDAFTAAHALKGLAGNMGFVPLFHAAGELVIYIRAGKLKEIKESNEQVLRCYRVLLEAIRQGGCTGRRE